MESLRFPVGRFDPNVESAADQRADLIQEIAAAPAKLRAALAGLSPEQLDTPYREGGWTVRQVAHHVPDSHMNAYVRFRLALTEDCPAIKSYEQQLWAELADTRTVPIDVSLALLDALHIRWVATLEGMSPQDFRRPLRHQDWGVIPIDTMLRLYAWHGRHHIAHITGLRARNGW
jgi:uncharacterized damage-inducible protein DinB